MPPHLNNILQLIQFVTSQAPVIGGKKVKILTAPLQNFPTFIWVRSDKANIF
jgi:hypothetical protein